MPKFHNITTVKSIFIIPWSITKCQYDSNLSKQRKNTFLISLWSLISPPLQGKRVYRMKKLIVSNFFKQELLNILFTVIWVEHEFKKEEVYLSISSAHLTSYYLEVLYPHKKVIITNIIYINWGNVVF